LDDLYNTRLFALSLLSGSSYDHDAAEGIEKWILDCEDKKLLLKAIRKLENNQNDRITHGYSHAQIKEKHIISHIKKLA